jgi:hypothetical protein
MKKSLFVSLVSVMVLFLLLNSNCSTAGFVWDPTGLWEFTITFDRDNYTFSEQLTFSGSDSSGQVSGFTFEGATGPETGTYTKTGDYSLLVHFEFDADFGDHVIINMNLTSSEASPNTMSGTGTDQEDEWIFDITVSCAKLSNLQ